MGQDNDSRKYEISVFSFFVAVASIIATLVYQLLDPSSSQTNNSPPIDKAEYAFVAVFSLFVAMSFALAYVHAKAPRKAKNGDTNDIKALQRFAGIFLDSFLLTSSTIAMGIYLNLKSPQEFTFLMLCLGIWFILFLSLVYIRMGMKPKHSVKMEKLASSNVAIFVLAVLPLLILLLRPLIPNSRFFTGVIPMFLIGCLAKGFVDWIFEEPEENENNSQDKLRGGVSNERD